MKSNYKTTVFALVSAFGSIEDPIGKEGLSKVVEQMLTYGTQRLKGEAFYFALESLGASIDVSVGMESFVINIRVLNENYNQAKELAVELLESPDLSQANLKLAISNVKGQLDEVKSDDISWALEQFAPPLLSQRSSYGTATSLDSISLEDVSKFITQLRSRVFTIEIRSPQSINIKGFHKHDMHKSLVKSTSSLAAFTPIEKELEQKVLMYGVSANNLSESSSRLRAVARGILSPGGLTGLVYEKVREENSAAYYAGAVDRVLTNSGAFLFYAGVSEKNIPMVIKLIDEIVQSVIEGNFEDRRIEMSKNSLKGSYANIFDDLDSLLGAVVTHLLLEGKFLTYGEIINEIDSISKAQIMQYYSQLFENQKRYILVNGILDQTTKESINNYLNDLSKK